eukprot:SAG31_NODE_12144_length_964_cov_1.493642_1_plen_160_part_10
MPQIVLTSKVCPKAVEATVYSLLAGFQNFGIQVTVNCGSTPVPFVEGRLAKCLACLQVGKVSGLYLIEALQIKTVAPNCDFSRLPTALIIAHFAMPMLAIPFTCLLIPDARLDSDIVHDRCSLGTTGTEEDERILPKQEAWLDSEHELEKGGLLSSDNE